MGTTMYTKQAKDFLTYFNAILLKTPSTAQYVGLLDGTSLTAASPPSVPRPCWPFTVPSVAS